MARYIDADKLKGTLLLDQAGAKNTLRTFPHLHPVRKLEIMAHVDAISYCVEEINKIPTAEVAEVKWKAIDGYEGLYEVSTFGQVRNAKGQILKPYLKHEKYTSYKKIALWKDGKYKHFSIHRLVAQAFIPNENNLPIVNHKDEDGTNNLVSNLEWCDRSYNATYGNATKRLKKSIKGRIIPTEQREKISNSMKRTRRAKAELRFEYDGEMLSIPEIAERLYVKQETLRARYRRTGSVFLGAKMDGGKEDSVV